MNNKPKPLAWLILLAVIAIAVVYGMFPKLNGRKLGNPFARGASEPMVTVRGPIGGEKIGFLADPEVQRILHDKYGLKVESTKAGSIDMVRNPPDSADFLWPSSQVALELYKERGGKPQAAETIFNSPIVLYSWDTVTDALIRAKVVQKQSQSYYIVDFPRLINMVNRKTRWKDLGLGDLYGSVTIHSTDPTKSNSGMMFAGLLANIMNNGEPVTSETLPRYLPQLKTFFGRLGYLEGSSSDLFERFLTLGEGENPIIVGYENQLTEYTLANSQYRDLIRKRIRILYPRPTVWSSHPLIALTPSGVRLLNACKDPDIQRIAWEKHGFRSGVLGIQNDPKVLQAAGIPDTIQNVIPMPRPQVMNRIIEALGQH